MLPLLWFRLIFECAHKKGQRLANNGDRSARREPLGVARGMGGRGPTIESSVHTYAHTRGARERLVRPMMSPRDFETVAALFARRSIFEVALCSDRTGGIQSQPLLLVRHVSAFGAQAWAHLQAAEGWASDCPCRGGARSQPALAMARRAD